MPSPTLAWRKTLNMSPPTIAIQQGAEGTGTCRDTQQGCVGRSMLITTRQGNNLRMPRIARFLLCSVHQCFVGTHARTSEECALLPPSTAPSGSSVMQCCMAKGYSTLPGGMLYIKVNGSDASKLSTQSFLSCVACRLNLSVCSSPTWHRPPVRCGVWGFPSKHTTSTPTACSACE